MQLTRLLRAVVGNSLGGFGLPAALWAHHPISRPEGGMEWAWSVLPLAVVVLAFAGGWIVMAWLERRQTPPAQRKQSPGR